MLQIVLDLLKFLLLVLLYVIIARAVRAISLELKGAAAGPVPRRAATAASKRAKKKAPTKAVVVQGDKKGANLPLDEELIIGRGESCRLVLEDSYVSTVHARIFAKGDTYM